MKKRPMDPKHLHAEDIAAIMTWYDHLEILMCQFQIRPSDIYNFDEFGFLEGQGIQRLSLHAFLRRMCLQAHPFLAALSLS